jgi:RNA polymerase sigma factor (sigma-70 family)
VLQSAHDAEDAMQATFLVLARRAGALRRPEALAGWLYGVAYRVARKMKTQRDKRGELERKATPPAPTEPADSSWCELRGVLDEELQRLPEAQRQPLLLCYFQGLTQQEAARQLGWPRGTLKRRLERGRTILKNRLSRRGLTLATALAATLPAGDALTVPPPAGWSATLARAAALFAVKKTLPVALAPVHVVTLAEGVLQTMFIAKVKLLSVVLAAALVLGFGAAAFAQQTLTPAGNATPSFVAPPGPMPLPQAEVDQPPPGGPLAGEQPPNDGLPKDATPLKGDAARLQGVWDGTGAIVLRLVRHDAGNKATPDGGKHIPLGQRWKEFWGTEHNHVRLVIRDEKQWETVWAKSMGAPPEAPVAPWPQPLAKVDFSKFMVLAAFMGDRENGGHIVDITRVVETVDGWTVYVREYSPPPDGTHKVTQQPYCLVVVPRFEGQVRFANEDGPARPVPGAKEAGPVNKQ